MKNITLSLFALIFSLSLFGAGFNNRAQTVEVYATVQSSPAKITIRCLDTFSGTASGTFTVSRKLKSENSWTQLTSWKHYGTKIPATISYDDTTPVVGEVYDYQVIYVGYTTSSLVTLYGYTTAGIEVPLVENRGGVILMIDDTFQSTLSTEIAQLQQDMEGDGWKVITKYVSRTATVPSVKKIITDQCAATTGIKALFLLGHVPVPYSGNQNPDGHSDHKGAWPADVFYGDLDGTWTDVTVNTTSATDVRNRNTPGDGKYDQATLPSDVELQVGRVDLFNLPVFTKMTELQLMQKYLKKNHGYRKKSFEAGQRALVESNFFDYATSSWRNFSSLVQPENSAVGVYMTSTAAQSYKWSYGSGAGSYTSILGVQSEGEQVNTFAKKEVQGIFTLLFGSYFGDWDNQNNILRQPLGSGTLLASAWVGTHLWQFQHMAMGENIGYSIKLSQNNNNSVFKADAVSLGAARGVFMALMGDPTLRNDIVSPVANLKATFGGTNCTFSWSAAKQSNLGYNLYVKKPLSEVYEKVNTTPIVDSSYLYVNNTEVGVYGFRVHTLVLQTSCSGTYYNMSEGIYQTAELSALTADTEPPAIPINLSCQELTDSSVALHWAANTELDLTGYDIYQDGVLVGRSLSNAFTVKNLSPTSTYIFTIKAKDAAGNSTNFSNALSVITLEASGLSIVQKGFVSLYPNPASDELSIDFGAKVEKATLSILDLQGRTVMAKTFANTQVDNLDISSLNSGIYFVKMVNGNKVLNNKFVKK